MLILVVSVPLQVSPVVTIPDIQVLIVGEICNRYRAAILTELHKLRSLSTSGVAHSQPEAADFPVLHLRRRASDWSPFV